MLRGLLFVMLFITSACFAQSHVIAGYFPAWAVYGRNYHVADIPVENLTHILYAFAVADNGVIGLMDPYADTDQFYPGDCWEANCLRGSFHQLQIVKQQHPGLETLISVGGWTQSAHFSDVALTPTSRATFATSCAAFCAQYDFDGVDIDWEFPVCCGDIGNVYRVEDRHNFTLLMQALRTKLDSLGTAHGGRHYSLTFASHALMTSTHYELSQLAATVDWINVMTYDFHGSWSSITNFNSPLYSSPLDPDGPTLNTDAAITTYLNAGVPADKIVMGIPFYGTGFAGVGNGNHGLYQPFTGFAPGTWETGTYDYWDIAANYLGNGYTRFWENNAQVPWLYNQTTQIMIGYDDSASVVRKAQYIQSRDLRGAMFWELAADKYGVLSHALHSALECNLVEEATVIRTGNQVQVHFHPDVAATYRVWTTTNRNNDGDPNGGMDPDWLLGVQMNVPAGPSAVWVDNAALGAYKNYVVTKLCP